MNLVKEFPDLFREIVEIVAQESYGSVRIYRHYSGRGMDGKECLGIDIDRETTQIEIGAKIMEKACAVSPSPQSFQTDVLDTLEQSNTDSLGLGTIIYFPTIDDPFIASEVAA
ncbi:hypothetical protein BH10ACI2_BH10ACI2_00360 [soil metagenome]